MDSAKIIIGGLALVFGLVMFYNSASPDCYGYIGSLNWGQQAEHNGAAFGGRWGVCTTSSYQYAIIASIVTGIGVWFIEFGITSRSLLSAKKSI